MKLSIRQATAVRALFLVLLIAPLAVGAPAQRGMAVPAAQTALESLSEVSLSEVYMDAAPLAEAAAPADASPLDDGELAALAALDEQPGDEVIGGALSNEHLTYIAIALAAAVLVLVLK